MGDTGALPKGLWGTRELFLKDCEGVAGGKKREPLDQRGRGQHSPLQFKACAQISSVKTYNYVFPFQGQVLGLRAKPPCTVAFSRVDKLVQILTAVLQKTGMKNENGQLTTTYLPSKKRDTVTEARGSFPGGTKSVFPQQEV